MQHVVDDVGVDFHSGIVDFSVRWRSQVGNAGRRRSDQNDFVFERSGREFAVNDVGNGMVGIVSARAVVIDVEMARGVRLSKQC